MQYEHSREGLIHALQGNLAKSYKRKKLKLSVDSPSLPTSTTNEEEMDIESDSDAASPVQFPLPRPNTEDSSNSADTNKQTPFEDTHSPSAVPENELKNRDDVDSAPLTALEEQKRKLLEELMASANENSNSNSSASAGATVDAKPTTDESVPALDATENNGKDECSEVEGPSTPIVGRSREVVVGTPLLKGVSPFASLPSGDKWSVGVSDVIDFENLPDATGTYKRLRGLISTVRTVVQRINDQNDAEDDDDDL